jgi:ubiquinone biosynthesis UbiH/UbiF/VisC/COQ6 family hydroxylase
VGAGPVGASLVRALREASVALVGTTQVAAPAEGFDPRVYALSPGNVEFLRRLGVWQAVPAGRVAPVHAMRIYGDDAKASLEFDAYEAGVPELAWIVEDGELQRALASDLQPMPVRCERLHIDRHGAELFLDGGETLQARLVVGADGANSFVRRAAGIAAADRDYGQSAMVANFRCEKPHRNTAYQWFQGGGVLALLPLPGEQVSMVWSLPTQEAERLRALPAEALAQEVERASRAALGALVLVSEARSVPLRRLRAARLVAPRLALAGDAGHVIHPLAGQGLNLGLQDARVLAQVVNDREPGRDPGDERLLRRYERQRAEPILAMDAVVSGLFALYGAKNSWIGRLRNAGLNLTDRLPVLKNLLMRQAMS